MALPLTQYTYIFVLFLCANVVIPSKECESEDNALYVIRSTGPNGLVLDATDINQIRVQHFTGSETQLWRFQPVLRPGLYYIINEQHRKALDFIMGDDGYLHLSVSDKKNCSQQYWNVCLNGHIINAVTNKNIDIDKANYSPGTRVIVWDDNGCPCQRFLLQKKL